jgi:Tol biopolymer transport system component
LPTKRLFADAQPTGACVWDWGPGSSLSNQVIYSQNEGDAGSGFYMMKEGGVHNPSNLLMTYSKAASRRADDVHWLPDGSGFLYSHFTNYFDVYEDDTKKIGSNIFRYDIATKKTTRVTNVTEGFASRFSISPDGEWIVYEKGYTAAGDDPNSLFELSNLSNFDLWIIKMDGTQEKLLVRNGSAPAWSR